MPTQSAEPFAVEAARVADAHRAEDIVVMDLRGLSGVTDYFVICTGTSDRQMRTVAERIREHGLRMGQRPFGVSGVENAQWILLDYVDVVIHVFDRVRRDYYDLELLWGDAPKIEWKLSATA